jgi:2-polyprenyl-3-methyl-5-hydroxy-6-metoxy-1,4-benzoquinol methylase
VYRRRSCPRAVALGRAEPALPRLRRAGLLPESLAGLRVLELGAGIGRFTGLLANHGAAHVHAVDFMQNLIDEVRCASPPSCVRAL